MQAEKIELIRLITEIDSELVIKKIKGILKPEKVTGRTGKASVSAVMVNRLEESRAQIKKGKGVKVTLDEI